MNDQTTAVALQQPQPVATIDDRPSDPMRLISAAMAAGAKPNEMTELYALVKQMRNDEAQARFGERLAEFQALCPRIYKGRKTQGSMAFAYASLDDIDAVVRPILANLGIVVMFDSAHTENLITVTVRVRVGSYYEDRQFSCPPPKEMRVTEAQKYGAGLSYAKRYALCAALNIVVTDEDNEDRLGGTIDADQLTELELLIRESGANESKFLVWAGVKNLADLPAAKYGEAVKMLRAKKGGAR